MMTTLDLGSSGRFAPRSGGSRTPSWFVSALGVSVLLFAGMPGCVPDPRPGADATGAAEPDPDGATVADVGGDGDVETDSESGAPPYASGRACPAGAAPITVFGPEIFTRAAGTPTRELREFMASRPGATYTIMIYNGEADGRSAGDRQRISSATIEVNGSTVVGPDRFSMDVRYICHPIDGVAPGRNELAIELRSRPGSFLKLWIVETLTARPLSELDFSAISPATCGGRPRGAALTASGVVVGVDPAERLAPGRLIIRFEDDVLPPSGVVPAGLAAIGVQRIERLSPREPLVALTFCGEADVIRLARELDAVPGVAWASTDPVVKLDREITVAEAWNLQATNAEGAWSASAGDEPVPVAVFDTGFDLTDPDLANRLWTNPVECPGGVCTPGDLTMVAGEPTVPGFPAYDDDQDCLVDEDSNGETRYVTDEARSGGPCRLVPHCCGESPCTDTSCPPPYLHMNGDWRTTPYARPLAADDDENGFEDDFHGADFAAGDGDPDAGGPWHATWVSGVVAAEHGNDRGVLGVCPNCRLIAVELPMTTIPQPAAGNWLSALPDLLAYARHAGARAVNMSWGGYESNARLAGGGPVLDDIVLPAV
ncbi:MAG: S8 family serine peptidase [Deltaproteobacteria bacterium]|nr:S8 family serine peptidase [Deltaproteobacteria bacterium]